MVIKKRQKVVTNLDHKHQMKERARFNQEPVLQVKIVKGCLPQSNKDDEQYSRPALVHSSKADSILSDHDHDNERTDSKQSDRSSRLASVISEDKMESRSVTPTSRPLTPEEPQSKPTCSDSATKDKSRSTTPALSNPLSRPTTPPNQVQSKPTSPASNNNQSRSLTPASFKNQSRQTSGSELQSRSTTNDNNFLRSPVVSRPNTPIKSVPLDSEEAKLHSQSTTLLIDEMIQSTISKAESNVSKLEEALSIERPQSSKMEEDAVSIENSQSRGSVLSEKRMDTPIPPTSDLKDSYEDEDFEDDDDISRSKSFNSRADNLEEPTEPDTEVIHGDDGPKVKFDSNLDLMVSDDIKENIEVIHGDDGPKVKFDSDLDLDDIKERNLLMASLASNAPSQKRPLSPLPPRNSPKSDAVPESKPAASKKTITTFKARRPNNASTLPLRQTKSLSPKAIGPRTLTSPRGRPANRGVGRGTFKGDLGKVKPPPKRPMPTLNDQPKIKLSARENPNKNRPLGPVWKPAGRATIKSNQWVTANEPLPPVARKQGLSPVDGGQNTTNPTNRQPLTTGKPKIPSQLQSEAWWQNGRFNITIRGPETVLPPLPSCLVSVSPGLDANEETDNIITEPIDVQITFRPEDHQVLPYRQNYFRSGAPIRKDAKPADRNVIKSRAAYPAFNTRIDTPKGVRGKLRTDRKPVKAYVNSISNPLNPSSQDK